MADRSVIGEPQLMTVREAVEVLCLHSCAPLLELINSQSIPSFETFGRTCIRVADVEKLKEAWRRT